MAVDTSRQARQAPPKFINSAVALLLRSPLHSIASKSLMLLTFTGRKSGKSIASLKSSSLGFFPFFTSVLR